MKPIAWRRVRGRRATDPDQEELAEHLMTALVLSLAHDLAMESRRKGVIGRDYIGDAITLIRQSRAHVLELLGCNRKRRAGEAGGEPPGPGLQEPSR